MTKAASEKEMVGEKGISTKMPPMAKPPKQALRLWNIGTQVLAV